MPTHPELNTRQKAYLGGLAQLLRAQLNIGANGVTDGTITALLDLFRGRELVKVRLRKSASEDPREVAALLAERSESALVNVVGRTAVLFRPNLELKERIALPGEPPPPAPAPPVLPARRRLARKRPARSR